MKELQDKIEPLTKVIRDTIVNKYGGVLDLGSDVTELTNAILSSPEVAELFIKEWANCDTCKFLARTFDGIHGETWTCPKLKPFIHILKVSYSLKQWGQREIAVEYGFGCKMYEPSPNRARK